MQINNDRGIIDITIVNICYILFEKKILKKKKMKKRCFFKLDLDIKG